MPGGLASTFLATNLPRSRRASIGRYPSRRYDRPVGRSRADRRARRRRRYAASCRASTADQTPNARETWLSAGRGPPSARAADSFADDSLPRHCTEGMPRAARNRGHRRLRCPASICSRRHSKDTQARENHSRACACRRRAGRAGWPLRSYGRTDMEMQVSPQQRAYKREQSNAGEDGEHIPLGS